MTKAELYKKACMLPLLPGVYIIRDKSDTIIYIGKAKRLRIRVSQYFREGVPHDNKVSQMIAHAYAFDVIVCQSEFEALVLEASQIKAHTPKYNILLKDDKGYSYIKVTREAWPRLSFVLQKEEDDAEYIGPYTSSFAARQMAETAMDAFLLPRCNKRFPQEIGKGRPCLNAHIGKCMAVCSGKISCETYNQAVKNAVHLIRYGKKDILKTLNERMQEASDRLEFETAALIRDQINAITKVTAGQKVVVDPEVEMDVVALAGTPSSVCAAVLRFREGRLTQCGADGSRGDGQGQRHAHDDRHQNAHDQRSLLGGPHDQGAHLTCGSANGCGDQHGKAHAGKNGHQRGDKDIDLGLLAHGLAHLSSHNGNDQDSQRAACAAQRIGRVAYSDQAEQHQRRAVQRPADGTGHGGAAHGRGVAAQIHQHLQPGLLAQRLDDGADEQTGEQALCHGAQCFNEVALRRNDDVLAL